MKNVLSAPFITEIIKITANMYRLGWHERNAGNISMMLDEQEAAKYLDLNKSLRNIPYDFDASELSGKVFLVTGTGKFFKNIQDDPEKNLGIVRINSDGKSAALLWGYSDGGKFTSEFASHLMCHIARRKANPDNKVVMHCHPVNLITMSYLHKLDDREFSRSLWRMCIEAVLVFPEGIGVLPWMLCGTNDIGISTSEKMKSVKVVLWGLHGVFGAGKDLDEAFGLLETAEKAAEVYLKTLSHPIINTVSDEQIRALAELWHLNYRKDYLD